MPTIKNRTPNQFAPEISAQAALINWERPDFIPWLVSYFGFTTTQSVLRRFFVGNVFSGQRASGFLGEIQLNDYCDNREVCIVEKPDTAVIATFFFPARLWIATGSLKGLLWNDIIQSFKVFLERGVTFFPALSQGYFELWCSKAKEISNECDCGLQVSDWLQKVGPAGGLKHGDDIAEFLLTNRKPHIKFKRFKK